MKSYLLDSNILIEYLNGQDTIVSYVDAISRSATCNISIISKIELISFPQLTAPELKKILAFLENFQIIMLTDEIALKTAELRRKKSLKLPDAVIASTAIVIKAILVSRDGVFKKLTSVKCVDPIDNKDGTQD